MRKFLSRLIKFSLILIVLSYLFVWFYEKPQREAYQAGTSVKLLKWNSIKNYPNKYDIIVLGSSRGYSSYNPQVIDSVTKMYSYNMCTNSQHIIESLYMFKEILKYQKPKYLVYEVFLPSFRTHPDFYEVFSNSKFMSNEMIIKEFFDNKLLDIFFPIYKYKAFLKNDISNLSSFKENIEEDSLIWIKGYRPSNKINDSVSIRNFSPIFSFSNTNVLTKREIEFYLKSLIILCDEYSVVPIFIRAPYPPKRMQKSLTDEEHIYFNEFFYSQKLTFYDLNYNSLKKYSDYDFEDEHHMNSKGAKKASIDLSEIIKTRTHNSKIPGKSGLDAS